MLQALDEMVLESIDENARGHIQEAVACYERGAYRAAIISAYIAVCFDLVAKLRALSADGDPQAKALVTDLNNYRDQQLRGDRDAIPSLLDFERTLLESFRDKFDFFGKIEFEELSRLRDDRNNCAHPTFAKSEAPYQPSAELARLHIRNAIKYVLSQQPKQGRAALASLTSVVIGDYFPNERSAVVERLRGTELGSAKKSLVWAFVDDVMFGSVTVGSIFYERPVIIRVLAGTIELHREIALPRVISNLNKLFKQGDPYMHRWASVYCLWLPEAAEGINKASQAVIATWLMAQRSEMPQGFGNAVAKALQISWLKDVAQKLIPSLTSEDIANITLHGNEVPREIFKHAVSLYANSATWLEANQAARCLVPIAKQFTQDDLDVILGSASIERGNFTRAQFLGWLLVELSNLKVIDEMTINSLVTKHGLAEYLREAQATQRKK